MASNETHSIRDVSYDPEDVRINVKPSLKRRYASDEDDDEEDHEDYEDEEVDEEYEEDDDYEDDLDDQEMLPIPDYPANWKINMRFYVVQIIISSVSILATILILVRGKINFNLKQFNVFSRTFGYLAASVALSDSTIRIIKDVGLKENYIVQMALGYPMCKGKRLHQAVRERYREIDYAYWKYCGFKGDSADLVACHLNDNPLDFNVANLFYAPASVNQMTLYSDVQKMRIGVHKIEMKLFGKKYVRSFGGDHFYVSQLKNCVKLVICPEFARQFVYLLGLTEYLDPLRRNHGDLQRFNLMLKRGKQLVQQYDQRRIGAEPIQVEVTECPDDIKKDLEQLEFPWDDHLDVYLTCTNKAGKTFSFAIESSDIATINCSTGISYANGYLHITFDGEKWPLHTYMYNGVKEKGTQLIRHLNDNKWDNRKRTLKSGSHSDNMRDFLFKRFVVDKKGSNINIEQGYYRVAWRRFNFKLGASFKSLDVATEFSNEHREFIARLTEDDASAASKLFSAVNEINKVRDHTSDGSPTHHCSAFIKDGEVYWMEYQIDDQFMWFGYEKNLKTFKVSWWINNRSELSIGGFRTSKEAISVGFYVLHEIKSRRNVTEEDVLSLIEEARRSQTYLMTNVYRAKKSFEVRYHSEYTCLRKIFVNKLDAFRFNRKMMDMMEQYKDRKSLKAIFEEVLQEYERSN
ncbi:hypothetical protein MP638_003741 [Amoeboaphelidium occidentale]|nr:hypothetical protein MP638_003741 [Amoeboaphelidium occidentale]